MQKLQTGGMYIKEKAIPKVCIQMPHIVEQRFYT